MYSKKIEELSKYLLANDSGNDELCRYLNFAIFNYLQSRSVIFCQLKNDGHVAPVASFGLDQTALDAIAKTSLAVETPISMAVVKDSCILVKSPAELLKRFPKLHNPQQLDMEWKSLLAVPVHAYGVFAIKTLKQPELDPAHESFLRVIGQLSAFAILKSGKNGQGKSYVATAKKLSSLTSRQEQIKKLMLRGMTNQEIASEIGYSDSLVRQETMAIYAILNISGRKELLENSGGGGN